MRGVWIPEGERYSANMSCSVRERTCAGSLDWHGKSIAIHSELAN
jgi:hypothetical protein